MPPKAAPSVSSRYLRSDSRQQSNLPKLAISLNDIAAGLDLDEESPTLGQLELAAQFSPILGEGDHLFSQEELAKVSFWVWNRFDFFKSLT